MVTPARLSKGCALCHRGSWLCVYVTDRCTRDCAFCSQHKTKEGFAGIRAYQQEPMEFDDAAELISYMKYWKLQGLGISGGEPLLVFPKTLGIISKARKQMPSLYIWLYTNGDLLNKARLLQLKRAGLDEIRFDLAARGYDLEPIRMARGIISNLTVEIPCIPEDKDRLASILPELQALGVRYLNLHELMVTDENRMRVEGVPKNGHLSRRKSRRKGGHAKVKPGRGSLSSARYILDLVGEKKLRLPINICSVHYKLHDQTRLMQDHMRKIAGKKN